MIGQQVLVKCPKCKQTVTAEPWGFVFAHKLPNDNYQDHLWESCAFSNKQMTLKQLARQRQK